MSRAASSHVSLDDLVPDVSNGSVSGGGGSKHYSVVVFLPLTPLATMPLVDVSRWATDPFFGSSVTM